MMSQHRISSMQSVSCT